MKRLDVSLAAGAALVAGWQQATAVTAWSGDTALSRSLTGDWADALLVNTGDAPVPAALSVTAAAAAPSLAPGAVFRRFFGAGGSFVLPLTARPGQRLTLAGDATATVLRPDGQVRQGRVIDLDGPAQAVVTHGAGPLALWIEGAGVSPWPATPPRDVTLPARVTLTGEAMALHLSPGAPVLLRLSGTAPAIVAIGNDPPVLFAHGIATARYLPAGDTLLHVLAPQDGPLSGSLELSGTPVVPGKRGRRHAGGHRTRRRRGVRLQRRGGRPRRAWRPRRSGPGGGAPAGRAWRDAGSAASRCCGSLRPATICWRRACRPMRRPRWCGPPCSAPSRIPIRPRRR